MTTPWRVEWNTPDGLKAGVTAPNETVRPRADYVTYLIDSLKADFGGTWQADWDHDQRIVSIEVKR